MLNFIDQKIRNAFSNAAMQYDVLTSLHKEIGRDLFKKVISVEPQRILDVGMGTGWLTNRLTHYFPGSIVVGLDFAPGMIEVALNQNEEGFKIIQANASQLPFKEEQFDLIVSNLAYHWVEGLPKAFQECHRKLKRPGTLALTMCGRQTFDELFVALENSRTGKSFPVHRLPDPQKIEEAVRGAGFQNIEINSERIKIRFTDMMALVKWTKDIGANVLEKDIYVGKDWLAKASEYYDQNFKDRLGIFATFEVVWIIAKK